MKKRIKEALDEARKRLDESLPEIEKRQKKAAEEGQEEPDHLKTGIRIDEVSVKRATKAQEHENLAEIRLKLRRY